MLFYATSNRRNIIKEVWQDQNMNELHSRDSINEKISLADRFGIKLFFDSMDQEQYFRLLENKAEAEGLDIPKRRSACCCGKVGNESHRAQRQDCATVVRLSARQILGVYKK